MSHKNKYLYNYIVNTLGLTKKMVMEQISLRLEDIVAKHIEAKLNSKYIEKLILDTVSDIMEKGMREPQFNGLYYKRTDFDAYLKKVLRDVIQDKLSNEYDAELKLVHKDTKTVKRV